MNLGEYNELTILRDTDYGLFLGDDEENDVLLPNKYCPEEFEIGDKLNVFVYLDHEERPVATTIDPDIKLHEFALLKVNAVTNVGAFMDWGLEKELMVPFKEQRQRMQEGRWYIVYLELDHRTNRLFATNHVERRLKNENLTVEEGEQVNLVVMQSTDIGFSVIINHKHKGMLYKNEVFKELYIGQKLKGTIKKIRDDNKIDVSLQASGYENVIDPNSEKILQQLTDNNGFLPLTDKSPPDDIYAEFEMSKKAFKKAVGALYKSRKISILPDGIKLN